VTEATRLVLTNALYLKAAWEVAFAKGENTDGPFATFNGKVIVLPDAKDGLAAIERRLAQRYTGWQMRRGRRK